MDKKIKSLFAQMASDSPNETDPIGGKIEQIILRYWKSGKGGKCLGFPL